MYICPCVFEHSTYRDKSQEHDGLNTLGKSKTSNGLWLILTFSHLGHATISVWEKWQTQKYIHGCHCYWVCASGWSLNHGWRHLPQTPTCDWFGLILNPSFLAVGKHANLSDQWVFPISTPSDTVRTCEGVASSITRRKQTLKLLYNVLCTFYVTVLSYVNLEKWNLADNFRFKGKEKQKEKVLNIE